MVLNGVIHRCLICGQGFLSSGYGFTVPAVGHIGSINSVLLGVAPHPEAEDNQDSENHQFAHELGVG